MKAIILTILVLVSTGCSLIPNHQNQSQEWKNYFDVGSHYFCYQISTNPKSWKESYSFALPKAPAGGLAMLQSNLSQAESGDTDFLALEIKEMRGVMLVLKSTSDGKEFHFFEALDKHFELQEVVNSVPTRSFSCQKTQHPGIPPKSLLVLYDGEASSN